MKVVITAQLRNGLLWEGVKKLGSQKALADHLGVRGSTLGLWLNFGKVPDYTFTKEHRAKKAAIEQKLMELVGATWDEVFPPELKSDGFQKRAKKLERMMEVTPQQLSEAHLLDALPPAPDEVVNRHELLEAIEKVVDTLRPRQAEILRMRFGLGQHREHTLEAVSAKIGVTRERIRQIESKALRDLRHPLRSKKLKPFL